MEPGIDTRPEGADPRRPAARPRVPPIVWQLSLALAVAVLLALGWYGLWRRHLVGNHPEVWQIGDTFRGGGRVFVYANVHGALRCALYGGEWGPYPHELERSQPSIPSRKVGSTGPPPGPVYRGEGRTHACVTDYGAMKAHACDGRGGLEVVFDFVMRRPAPDCDPD